MPKATVQQSGFIGSLSEGSKLTTGACYRGSQTLTQPSVPPVTISGAPYSAPLPPIPSIVFAIFECAWTSYFDVPRSISQIVSFPLKSTVATSLIEMGDILKVPALIPNSFFHSLSKASFPFSS